MIMVYHQLLCQTEFIYAECLNVVHSRGLEHRPPVAQNCIAAEAERDHLINTKTRN